MSEEISIDQLLPGNPSRGSNIHVSDATVAKDSRKHTEEDISRLQSAVNTYDILLTYKIGDYTLESNLVYRNVIAITTPEAFTVSKWSLIGDLPATKIQLDATISDPGEVSYNTTLHCMEVKGLATTLQVGQESHVPVINKTGVTIPEGMVVRVTGYDSTADRQTIALSQADKLSNSRVLGLTTTTMLDNEEGKVTIFGRVNDIDTSSFSEGSIVFLSDSVPGGLSDGVPAISIPIKIGVVGKSDVLGWIHIDIEQFDLAIHAQLSDSTNQNFVSGVSKSVTLNNNDVLEGIDHSTTVDNDEITFISAGNYNISVKPQYKRTSGGGTDILNLFIQKSIDNGLTWVNVSDSNVKLGIGAAGVDTVSTLSQTMDLNESDKIRIMINATSSNITLEAFAGTGTPPDDIPQTPSVIVNISRNGL